MGVADGIVAHFAFSTANDRAAVARNATLVKDLSKEGVEKELLTPRGGMAGPADLRRTTLREWVKENRSGSSFSQSAACCIRERTVQ
jgi:hypothetical protein